MSLISSAPFSNVTVYRQNYTKKIIPRVAIINPDQDSDSPISGPVIDILKLEEEKNSKGDSPATKLPVDIEVIKKFRQDDKSSVYMLSYCARGDYESNVTRKRIRQKLPDDWEIPLTTQKCSYRTPCQKFGVVQRLIPKDNLDPNPKEREILEVKTGESIYISDISNTGMEIIKGKLHGDINVRPVFNEDDLLRAKLIRRD